MKSGIIYGFVSGLLAMSYVVAIYLDQPLNLISGLEKLCWLIFFSGMLLGVWRERSLRNEPFITFQESLKTAYQIFIIAYLIKFTTVFVIFNYVEPSLNDSAREIAVEIFIKNRDPKIAQELFEQQLEAYKKGFFGPRIFDIGIMLELIAGFVLAAFSAFLIKREKPEF